MVEPNPSFFRSLNELRARQDRLKLTAPKMQTEVVAGATASEPFYSKEVRKSFGNNKWQVFL